VLGALASLGLVPLLSGCLVFSTYHASAQLSTIGDVTITSTVCTKLAGTTCAWQGLSGLDANTQGETQYVQVLVGFRVPAGSQAPASFSSSGQVALDFVPSASYAAELQRLSPAPSAQKWVGYVSTTAYSYNSGTNSSAYVREGTATAQFTLPPAADGGPFPSPFRFRPVVGMRGVTDTQPATLAGPVVCDASNLSALNLSTGALCVSDTGRPGLFSSASPAITSDQTFSTRDLGIPTTGVTGTASPGGIVSLPFIARYSGTATAAATFSLTASTTLPGATAIPALSTLAPASNSDTPVPVAVGVPAGASPGIYDVTLTAKLTNGQTRAGTGKLTVAATGGGTGGGGSGGGGGGGGTTPAATGPKIQLILPPRLSARAARRHGVRVLIGSTTALRATVEILPRRGTRPLARRAVRLRAPGPIAATLKSARLRVATYRVVVRGTGFRVTKTLSLRRP
jgi:hypothetical protein